MIEYYLNNLYLKNFRSYLNETKINFGSRLTLLFGKGSAGKSTIIDALQILQSSQSNGVDLYEKNYKFLTSKQSNSNNFSIGFTCSQNDTNGNLVSTKSIKKDFEFDKKEIFFPETISLYSSSEPRDKNKKIINSFSMANKFLSLKNSIIKNNKEKNLKDYCLSEVTFIENEYAWKELYEYHLTYKKELIEYLDKVFGFAKKYYSSLKNIENLKKKGINKNKIDKLEQELNTFFNENWDPAGFSPGAFPFGKGKKIDGYFKFLNKKDTSFQEFINFVSDDIKKIKVFLYKNHMLYGTRELHRVTNESELNLLNEKVSQQVNKRLGLNPTFAEFLCVCLTELCSKRSMDKKSSDYMPYPIIAEKDSFRWSMSESAKVLAPKEMLSLCRRVFSPSLKQIKTIRHDENVADFIKLMSRYSSSATIKSDFHEAVQNNIKEINKWMSEFGYDFKITIDKIGIKGETEIMHKKNNFKIPSELGGSGAQYLLTYLTQLLDSNGNTILLEEPEKALHASLQIKLANLFCEISEKNQIVIETHSENLLLGIQKLVRDKKIKPEDVSVLYVYMNNGVSRIDELELNSKGGFTSKWKDGFFTEKLDLL